jgi:hypothetical protein
MARRGVEAELERDLMDVFLRGFIWCLVALVGVMLMMVWMA